MIYFAQPVDGGPIKIGYSADVPTRIRQLEAGYKRSLAVLHVIPGDLDTEKEIHQRFSHLRFGLTEQFKPSPDLLAFIGRPLLVSANPDAVEPMGDCRKPTIASFKGSNEFGDWCDALADHCRLSTSSLIEHALVAYAKQQGFKQVPPKR